MKKPLCHAFMLLLVLALAAPALARSNTMFYGDWYVTGWVGDYYVDPVNFTVNGNAYTKEPVSQAAALDWMLLPLNQERQGARMVNYLQLAPSGDDLWSYDTMTTGLSWTVNAQMQSNKIAIREWAHYGTAVYQYASMDITFAADIHSAVVSGYLYDYTTGRMMNISGQMFRGQHPQGYPVTATFDPKL